MNKIDFAADDGLCATASQKQCVAVATALLVPSSGTLELLFRPAAVH
jgi:hypothetical protein